MGWIGRVGIGLGLLLAGSAQGLTLDAVDRGWYRSDGFHDPANENYIVGDCRGGFCTAGFDDFRSFFVFDLSGVSGPVNAATLRLFNPVDGFASDGASETITLHDVITATASVTGATGGLGVWLDLGAGTVYGTRSVTAADDGEVIEIDLVADGLAAVQAASGLLAIGARISTLNGVADQETAFAFASGLPTSATQLVLAPEPGAPLLAAAALLALALRTRRA